jgi:antitoxin VapB
MGLNIKNREVEAAIRQLAERTGESLTDAINHAVREKLARLDDEATRNPPVQSVGELLERIRPLQEEAAAFRRAHGDTRSAAQVLRDFDDEFYDEDGVPK